VTHIGVSRKIASDEERHRLKRILVNERGEASGGFIVRTAAEGASEEELRADLRFLIHLWMRSSSGRHVEVSGAYLSRPVADRAYSSRPGKFEFLEHLGGFGSGLRTYCALPEPFFADAGSAREALHQGDAAF